MTEKRKEYLKTYYEANKAKCKAYRQAHKEERKAYRAAHKAEAKAYRATHKAEAKAYREAHRDEAKEYREVHRDEAKVYAKSHREYYLRKYYCINLEEVENYNLAKKDNFKGWDIHHRLETYNSDGERRSVDITRKELMKLGMYYNRPASELIFIKHKEHVSLHKKGKKNEN
jgi:hypothetical protein